MSKEFYVYIATNKRNTVLYTGVTRDIKKRMYEHKHRLLDGFTKKYNVNKLVFLEVFNGPKEAINAEKRIKGWTRRKKLELIKSINPEFKDLAEEIE